MTTRSPITHKGPTCAVGSTRALSATIAVAWIPSGPCERGWSTAAIRAIHEYSHGTYGAPRVHAQLLPGLDVHVSRKRVARLMRPAGYGLLNGNSITISSSIEFLCDHRCIITFSSIWFPRFSSTI